MDEFLIPLLLHYFCRWIEKCSHNIILWILAETSSVELNAAFLFVLDDLDNVIRPDLDKCRRGLRLCGIRAQVGSIDW
jgi:hypothetical protein